MSFRIASKTQLKVDRRTMIIELRPSKVLCDVGGSESLVESDWRETEDMNTLR